MTAEGAWLTMVAAGYGYSPPVGECPGCGCAIYPADIEAAEDGAVSVCDDPPDGGCPFPEEVKRLAGDED